jgi:hypothetical protein
MKARAAPVSLIQALRDTVLARVVGFGISRSDSINDNRDKAPPVEDSYRCARG